MARRKQAVITPALERDVVHLLLTDPRFHARIGFALPVEMLPTDHARLVLGIANAFYVEAPNATLSLSVVAQRLARQRAEGKLTSEDVDDAFDWIEADILTGAAPEREGVIHEVATEIKRVRNHAHVQNAMEMAAKRGSLKAVAEAIQETERLGLAEEHIGAMWDDGSELLRDHSQAERLPTGIEGLDFALEGGLPRGCLTYGLGSSGAGKSMLLSQIAAEALANRQCPYIATLEVSERKWGFRLRSAASDIPIRAIRDNQLTAGDLLQLKTARNGMVARIDEFRASAATPEDLFRAFDAEQHRLERAGSPHRYTVMIVDYADKLVWPSHIKASDTYNGQKYVYEALRQFARDRNIWVVTASQATRREKKRAKEHLLTLEDSADSIHKARIADVGFTINVSSDRQMIRVYLDKNREGEGGFLSDYIDTAYAFGRLTRRPPPPAFVERGRSTTSADLPF